MANLPVWLQLLLPKAKEITVEDFDGFDIAVTFGGEQVGLPRKPEVEVYLYINPDDLTYYLNIWDVEKCDVFGETERSPLGTFAEFISQLTQASGKGGDRP